jgi:hypothetical protein
MDTVLERQEASDVGVGRVPVGLRRHDNAIFSAAQKT